MVNRTYGRQKPPRTVPVQPAARPKFKEPVMRRWPHSSESAPGGTETEAAISHYLHCSLSYQNQLLADIKALLERLDPGEKPKADSDAK